MQVAGNGEMAVKGLDCESRFEGITLDHTVRYAVSRKADCPRPLTFVPPPITGIDIHWFQTVSYLRRRI
jgi:hypothetical protein